MQFWCIVTMLAACFIRAQTISNVDFNSSQGNCIEITYDFYCSDLQKRHNINVVLNSENGTWYRATKLRGDYAEVKSGNEKKLSGIFQKKTLMPFRVNTG